MRRIETERAPRAIGPYSQAIEAGGFIFTAGQIGIDPETGELREGVEAQVVQAMQNLQSILEAAGLSFQDVVKTTIFLVNMDDFKKVNEVYARYFREPYPARSTVGVKELPKGALVEIEVVALKR